MLATYDNCELFFLFVFMVTVVCQSHISFDPKGA